jgi:hypothetical protein
METLTAAAAGFAPVYPPADWFADPELAGPTALTVTRDGRIYGHAALWDSCHVGFPGRCIAPPRSSSGYSHFHLGEISTAEGHEVFVGKITLASGHASTASGMTEQAARAHYDDTGTVAAYVRAGDDQYGIWLAGSVRSDLPAERLQDLRANPVSGDWRNGELIAAHCVPTPGFPVPRVASRLAASAAEPPLALVVSTGLMTNVSDEDAWALVAALAASALSEPERRLARPGSGR